MEYTTRSCNEKSMKILNLVKKKKFTLKNRRTTGRITRICSCLLYTCVTLIKRTSKAVRKFATRACNTNVSARVTSSEWEWLTSKTSKNIKPTNHQSSKTQIISAVWFSNDRPWILYSNFSSDEFI